MIIITIENKKYLIVNAEDSSLVNIKKYFDKFLVFINENKNTNILIHCQHGSSRTGTFVLLYLIDKYNISYDTALEIAKKTRCGITPNDGFKNQLICWMNNRKKTLN